VIPRLHLVTDDRVLEAKGFPGWVGDVVDVGGERVALHLRGPRTSGRRLWELGRELGPRLRERGTLLLVNDRADVALALEADGVHLGRRSFPVGPVRALLGEGRWLGRSVSGGREAEAVHRETTDAHEGARLDFAFAGAIFETASHPGRAGGGADRVREVRASLPGIPVLGIGGVTPARVAEIVEAGGHGVAVIRAVWGVERPGEAVAEFLERLRAAHRASPRRDPEEMEG